MQDSYFNIMYMDIVIILLINLLMLMLINKLKKNNIKIIKTNINIFLIISFFQILIE